MRRAVEIGITSMGIGLVALATISLQVSIPATQGYFNLGETMVYTFALLFGPKVGLIAGGIGSALADLITGYLPYAPATLVIKALEGYIVGYLSRALTKMSEKLWRILTIVLAIFLSLLALGVGTTYYLGPGEIALGLPFTTPTVLRVFFTVEFWIIVAVALLIIIIFTGVKVDPRIGAIVLSVVIGGIEMVAGYFLYEQFVLGYMALAEVPFNVCQMIIGLLVAVPLYRSLKPYVEQLKFR